MSVEFLRTFFPHANAFLERYAPSVLERAFPQWVRDRCPGPRYNVTLPGGIALRHISLLPLQLAGIAIGCAALRRTDGFWRWSFAAFALMNFFSIFAHDFGTAGTPSWRIWATLDVVFTCVADLCVVLAARAQADSSKHSGRGAVGAAVALGITAAASLAGFGFGHVPFVHEFLYIGTAGIAFAYCLALLVLRPSSTWTQRLWLLLASLGAGLMAVCLQLDGILCHMFGSHIDFVHLLFLGCDIVFFAFLNLYPAGTGLRVLGDTKLD